MGERILLGITGASGTIYAERAVQCLLPKVDRLYILFTDAGREVARHELLPEHRDCLLLKFLEGEVPPEWRAKVRLLKNDDFFAPVASGSSVPSSMLILPCSMGTLARVAQGVSSNLMERAADVVLKERKRLVICPREMPLNAIHLRHMLSLTQMGAMIVPPSPAFYQKPKTMEDMIDFITGRILESLNIEHDLYARWNSRMS